MLGNSEVGSPSIATTPTMTIMIEITMETMGRFMKNLYTVAVTANCLLFLKSLLFFLICTAQDELPFLL